MLRRCEFKKLYRVSEKLSIMTSLIKLLEERKGEKTKEYFIKCNPDNARVY